MGGQGDLTISVPTPQDLKAMSPRHQVFMELLHTEMNYVEILETIVEVWCYLLRLFRLLYRSSSTSNNSPLGVQKTT